MMRESGKTANGNALESSARPSANTPIYSHKLDTVTWLALVHQIIVQYYVCAPRELPCGRTLWHLLDADSLMVSERAVSIFYLQRLTIVVRLGSDRRSRRKIRCGGCRVAVLAFMEQICLWTIMYRLEHLRADQRATRDDSFQGDHRAQLCSM